MQDEESAYWLMSLGEAAAIEISEIRPPTGTESQRSSRRSEGSVGHRGTESAPMSAPKYPWKMNIVKLNNKLQQNKLKSLLDPGHSAADDLVEIGDAVSLQLAPGCQNAPARREAFSSVTSKDTSE